MALSPNVRITIEHMQSSGDSSRPGPLPPDVLAKRRSLPDIKVPRRPRRPPPPHGKPLPNWPVGQKFKPRPL